MLGPEYYKEEQEESKCSECDQLQTKNASLQQLINEMVQSQNNEQSQQNLITQQLQQQLKQIEKQNDEHIQKYNELKSKEDVLTQPDSPTKQ